MKRLSSPPSVLLNLPLAYQDGRDKYIGFLRYASEHRASWHIILERDLLTAAQLKRLIRETDADALVMGGTHGKEDIHTVIALSRMPCVLLDDFNRSSFFVQKTDVAFANTDGDAIGELAARTILNRKSPASIAFIGYAPPIDWSVRREASYRRLIQATGKTCLRLHIPYLADLSKVFSRKVGHFLTELPKPAFVFVAHDRLSRRVADIALSLGISIPNDVAILGVDNEEISCTLSRPSLSSIQPDFTRLGYEAARALDEMLRTQRGPKDPIVVSGVRLVERESTASTYSAALLVSRIKETVSQSQHANIHISDIVRKVGASRRLVDQRFREITGETLLDFIRREKLEHLKKQLVETELPISVLCDSCGFRSPNHLKRLFRSHTGQTMSAWRKNSATRKPTE